MYSKNPGTNQYIFHDVTEMVSNHVEKDTKDPLRAFGSILSTC